ncbi:MAG: hypothetical protein ABH863_03900 [Candidatus Micrarchaeota archaeon]
MEILQDKENKLFARREMVLKIAVEKETPSRKTVVGEIQKQFAASEESIIIDKIEHPFGTKYAKVHVKIYEKPEGAKREPSFKKERGKEKKAEEKK